MKRYSAKLNKFITLFASFLAVFAVLSASCVNVYADETKRIHVGDCVYDTEENMFVYTALNGTEVHTTVVDDMYTTDPVRFSLSGGVTYKLYKNGDEVDTDISYITEPGHYVFDYSSSNQKFEAIRFIILDKITGKVDEYVMPDEFFITDVYYNGEKIAYEYNRVDLTDEGEYEIRYYCRPNEMKYSLNVEIDHTAPLLELSNIVDGVANGPVTVSETEEGAKLYIEKNGKEVSLYPGRQLLDSGNYYISVTDRAGNETSRSFKIMFYLNIDTKVFFLMTGAFVLFVITALIVRKKRRRVR